MAQKRGGHVAVLLYFFLLFLLMLILILHIFGIYQLNTDFFARYIIALIFVLLLLPTVPKIKIFDVVEVKREARMFKSAAARQKSRKA